MEWKLNVPKILHLYWDMQPLPYLRYFGVRSFIECNPDWKIFLWYPKHQSNVVTWSSREQDYKLKCDDYLQDLLNLPIEKNCIDFEDIGFFNNVSEVHKSDYLRLYLLYEYGGVWSDIDIFYFKSINNLLVNSEENRNVETFVNLSHFGHSTAFMMANNGSKFFETMMKEAKEKFNSDKYQCIGSDLCNEKYSNIQAMNTISPSIDIGMDSVMSHDGEHIKELYNGTRPRFTNNTIGVHWYAGHQLSGEFLNRTNGGLINLPNNIIGNLLKSNE